MTADIDKGDLNPKNCKRPEAERLSALVREYFPDAEIEVHKDMSGKDRMLSVCIEDPHSDTDAD